MTIPTSIMKEWPDQIAIFYSKLTDIEIWFQPVLWGRKLGQQNFLRVDYKQLMEELPVLQQVLEQLHTFGLLLVTDSPQRAGIVEKICNRIGHLRTTHYGWVKARPYPTKREMAMVVIICIVL